MYYSIIICSYVSYSPTSTGGSHTASVKPSNVPHQVATSGEEYALTTKVNTTTKPPQQPTEEYAMVDKNKKHAAVTQGVSCIRVCISKS